MISGQDIEILRSITRAGGDYGTIKRLLAETDWKIDEDDTDLGYLRILIPTDLANEYYTLIIGYQDPNHAPYSLLTFACFPDSEERIAAFNAEFRSAAEAINRHLGKPATSGDRRLSFRTWSYSYQRWSLPEGEYTLVQDEFDIQSGMDVTLWIQPVGTTIQETLRT
jgi:hypothetical protein